MRRLIVCCDGTWNSPDQELDEYDVRKPTNVVKLARSVVPVASDGTSQIVFYDTGIGTHSFVDKFVGGATGKGLSQNIIEAYRFLVNNFDGEDEIYLFGFSRGGFTARSLAGLIGQIGLLPKQQEYWLPEGYEMYRERDDRKAIARYRKLNKTRSVTIRMVGVWDTVGALGIPFGIIEALTRRRYQFHDVTLSACVQHAYQALAIDEHRSTFQPAIWESCLKNQVVEQQWFPGVHTNVGGGYADNGIANHALMWMVDRANALGLETNSEYLGHFVPDSFGDLYDSKTGIYRFDKNLFRAVGRAGRSANERLHQSAIERYKGDRSYRPKNVPKRMWKRRT
jgi:uncharacterized protein (DUF2235 family)